MKLKLKCNRCKHIWPYTGAKKFTKDFPQYVSCPRCLSKVRIEEVKKTKQTKSEKKEVIHNG